MKNMFKGFGLVVLFLAFIAVVSVGGWAWKYFTAAPKGIVEAEVMINSGQNRIQEYDKFHDMCMNVQTMKASLSAQRDLLGMAEDKGERSRIRANIAGMQSQLARYVNQYNSDSNKDYTSARFKDSGLPFQLSTQGTTNC